VFKHSVDGIGQVAFYERESAGAALSATVCLLQHTETIFFDTYIVIIAHVVKANDVRIGFFKQTLAQKTHLRNQLRLLPTHYSSQLLINTVLRVFFHTALGAFGRVRRFS
jgi:hypothetical protein